jgi:hypothetical protein
MRNVEPSHFRLFSGLQVTYFEFLSKIVKFICAKLEGEAAKCMVCRMVLVYGNKS